MPSWVKKGCFVLTKQFQHDYLCKAFSHYRMFLWTIDNLQLAKMLLQLIRKLRGLMDKTLVPSWVERLHFESAHSSWVKAVRKNFKTGL